MVMTRHMNKKLYIHTLDIQLRDAREILLEFEDSKGREDLPCVGTSCLEFLPKRRSLLARWLYFGML